MPLQSDDQPSNPMLILGVKHSSVDARPLPGACDCHTHVFGLPSRFPFDPARTYTPSRASAESLLAHQHALGLDRVVIVQPSPYGTDNACTLDALQTLGDRARGVAVIAPDLSRAALQRLHDGSMRGVRLNLETVGQHDPAVASRLLRAAAEHVAHLGWHVQVYTSLPVLASLHQDLLALPVLLVIDHFGRAMARDGVEQPGFDALLDLVSSGSAYVKLSAAHRIAEHPDDAAPIAAALIAANPARMLWGSDWPHPAAKPLAARNPQSIEPFDPIDDGQALNRLHHWTTHADTLHAILVANPARLYGFS